MNPVSETIVYGLLLLLICWTFGKALLREIVNFIKLRTKGVRSTGIIKRVKILKSSALADEYQLTITYTDPDGKIYDVEQHSNYFSKPVEGEYIAIFYDEKRPEFFITNERNTYIFLLLKTSIPAILVAWVSWMLVNSIFVLTGFHIEQYQAINALKLLSKILFFILLMLLILKAIVIKSFKELKSAIELKKTGIVTNGIVKSLKECKGSEGATLYRPLIEFSGLEGKKYSFFSRNAMKPAPPIGTYVDVLYDASDPSIFIWRIRRSFIILYAKFILVVVIFLAVTIGFVSQWVK